MRIIVYGDICTSKVYPTGGSITLYRVLGSGDSEVTLGIDVLEETCICSTSPARKGRREKDASKSSPMDKKENNDVYLIPSNIS